MLPTTPKPCGNPPSKRKYRSCPRLWPGKPYLLNRKSLKKPSMGQDMKEDAEERGEPGVCQE
jgi:hypothetical protein